MSETWPKNLTCVARPKNHPCRNIHEFLSRRVRTGIPNTEVKIFMKTRLFFPLNFEFTVISGVVKTWNQTDTLHKTNYGGHKSVTDQALQPSEVTRTRGKKSESSKCLFRKRSQQWEQTTSREGCNHSELLIYPNLNLMNKEKIIFLKSIFLTRCANKQNIRDFIYIRNIIKILKQEKVIYFCWLLYFQQSVHSAIQKEHTIIRKTCFLFQKF